ncbi:MAG: CapA family protein [Eubacteriales bacterium]|nr:CapA family protein [Eubacteriales bacterium]
MTENLSLKDRLRIKMKSSREFSTTLILIFILILSLGFSYLLLQGYNNLTTDPAVASANFQPMAQQWQDTAVADGSSPNELALNFYGSLEMDQGLRWYLENADFKRFFSQLMPALSAADLNIVSLDSPLNLKTVAQDSFSKQDLEGLKSLNFRIFSLANANLCPDRGQATQELISDLNALPLDFIGLGENINAAARSYRIPYGEKYLSLFSTSAIGRNQRASLFEAGMSIATDIQLFDRITREKVDGGFVVVMVHWGNLYNTRLGEYQAELAHRFIDAGADLVIGSSLGAAAKLETYKNSFICYNLGSLRQSQGDGLLNPGYLLSLELHEDREPKLNFTPISQTLGLPNVVDAERLHQSILNELLRNNSDFAVEVGEAGDFTVSYPHN